MQRRQVLKADRTNAGAAKALYIEQEKIAMKKRAQH
jgi:hypothetical protein